MNDTGNIKIAHFVRGYLHPTETFILNQINTLEEYEPVVIGHHHVENGLVSDKIIPVILTQIISGFKLYFQKIFYKFFKALAITSVSPIVDFLKKNNVKLLHFHFLVDARFFLSIMKRYKVPAVVSAYGWDVSAFPNSMFGLGQKYLSPVFKEAEIFIAMSADMKRDLIKLGCPEEKIVVHYHGINIERFLFPGRIYEDKNIINILFCGSLMKKKGPDRILKALKNIEEKKLTTKSFILTIVGNGPLRNYLENLIKEYGWEKKVLMKGYIPHFSDELLYEYKKADVFVFPCRTSSNLKEGIPGTIVEAMSSGLPIVSSFHAGIPEIISSGTDGLLCNEDSDSELIEKIVCVLNNFKLREQLGKAAQSRAKNYNVKIKTRELENIYSHLLSKSNAE